MDSGEDDNDNNKFDLLINKTKNFKSLIKKAWIKSK